MRVINILAALFAAIGFAGLAAGAHMHSLAPEDAERVKLVASLQIGVAALAFALTGRTGRISLIGASLLIAGVTLFSGDVSALVWMHSTQFIMAAPLGGMLLILGSLTLAFSNPKAKS